MQILPGRMSGTGDEPRPLPVDGRSAPSPPDDDPEELVAWINTPAVSWRILGFIFGRGRAELEEEEEEPVFREDTPLPLTTFSECAIMCFS